MRCEPRRVAMGDTLFRASCRARARNPLGWVGVARIGVASVLVGGAEFWNWGAYKRGWNNWACPQ